MKPHRFDPLSFVIGLSTAIFGALVLWGDLDVADMRPSRLWPLPVLALGLLFSLYGVRRLLEASRPDAPDEPDQTETAEAPAAD